MFEIVGICVAILAALFIGYPFFKPRNKEIAFELNHQAEDLLARKDEIYAAIKDIDFDYQMGKLSDDDYQTLRQQYKTDAISLLKKIDLMQGVGKGRHHHKGAAASGRFCAKCGEPATKDARFCARCGSALQH